VSEERAGRLPVGDGNEVYWELHGAPSGRAGGAAVVLHGGPGSGSYPGAERLFDLERWRVLVFDQRGCGRSTPHASDPATDLSVNTTDHLLRDMELLRAHHRIESWLLFGASWGSTLALAYAERHPERVSGIVLLGVTMTRRSEIDWLYRRVAPLFPEQWQRFREGVPAAERDGDLVEAYARLLESPDPRTREAAARNWHDWEAAHLSVDPDAAAPSRWEDPAYRLARARIVTHYFRNAAWLDEGALLAGAHALRGIRGVLVQGRLDLASPLVSAWELARAWPDAELVVVKGAGHSGGDPGMYEAVARAIASFSAQ